MKFFCKGIIFSVILSLILLFFLSVLVSVTDVSESVIKPATIGITALSLMIGAFYISKNKREKGILNGIILGIIYMLVLYIISSLVNLEFSLNLNSLIMIILGIIGGAIGGILGVNM